MLLAADCWAPPPGLPPPNLGAILMARFGKYVIGFKCGAFCFCLTSERLTMLKKWVGIVLATWLASGERCLSQMTMFGLGSLEAGA